MHSSMRLIAATLLAGCTLLAGGCGASVADRGMGSSTTTVAEPGQSSASTTSQSATTTASVPSSSDSPSRTASTASTADCAPGTAEPDDVEGAIATFTPFVEAVKNDDQACGDRLVSKWFVTYTAKVFGNTTGEPWISFTPLNGFGKSLEEGFQALDLPIDTSKITHDDYTRPIFMQPGKDVPETTDEPQPSGLMLSYPMDEGHLEVDLIVVDGKYLVDDLTIDPLH